MRSILAIFLSFVSISFAHAQTRAIDTLSSDWPKTDFSITSVDIQNEVRSGGPGKDGIPSINFPKFLAVSEETRLDPREPVMTLEFEGQTRAYPIRYLMWHEIVNDRINDIPVSVTYCPLCNSGIVFDGRIDGVEYSFGVSGNLRNSDMVMYDHQTESWWQQFLGEGIVGEMTGKRLETLPAWMESWESFKTRNPDGLVLDEPIFPGAPRRYGANPYRGYDSLNKPFLYDGQDPPHGIEPLARVVVVEKKAWPLTRLAKNGTIQEEGIVITWAGEMASALDEGVIAKGRSVSQIRVQDAKTGKDIAHDVAFAFAFHAFHPDGIWQLGE